MTAWVAGALLTQEDREQALVLALAQGILALFTIEILRTTLLPARSAVGVYVLPVVALHVALYYGISNIVPALLIGWRPQYNIDVGVERIPLSPISAYLAATWAALSLLVGVSVGAWFANGILSTKRKSQPSQYVGGRIPWLPGYRNSLAIAVGLACVVLFCTLRYGTQYYSTFSDEDQLAALPLWEQLLFHGVFPFLPFPAFLAATAVVSARTRLERRWAVGALSVLALFSIAVFTVWGMRGPAILAFLLPVGLFVYTGFIRWQRVLVPATVLVSLVYAGVTVARVSSLGEQVGDATDVTLGTASEALKAGADKDILLERLASDLSYRTSGLEPVAGIVFGQELGVLRPMGGRVILAGFVQSLPAAIRPEAVVPDRIKTVPSQNGWFGAGDWVTTLLSELVMDVGPWLVVLPAVGVGLLLTLVDRLLLSLGQSPTLRPLLVLRFGWLLMVLNAGSLADLTLMFVKGSVGYAVLFVLFGIAGTTIRKGLHT